MKRALIILFAAAFFIGCETENDNPKIKLSHLDVLLGYQANVATTITITANCAWELTTSSSQIKVSKTEGKGGETKVTIEASKDNNGSQRLQLGTITIRATNGIWQHIMRVEQRAQTATHTSLIYMTGRDLIGYYEKNLKALKSSVTAQMPGDGRIMVCYQPKSATSAELYEIYFDLSTNKCEQKLVKSYAEFNPSNKEAITMMINEVKSYAPSNHYGMTIGCHGKGWISVGKGLRSFSLKEDRNFWTYAPGGKQTRAFGDTGYEIDIKDLAEAIEATGEKLEYLIFDACFMANIETIYDLRNITKNIIGSTCEVMAAGYPYNITIPHLFVDQGRKYDLKGVCKAFYEFYMYDWASVGSEQSGCISLAKTNYIEALAETMKRVNGKFKRPNTADIQIYEGLSTHLFYDLGDWVNNGCTDTNLKMEFFTKLEEAFPIDYLYHTPGFYSGYSYGLIPVNVYTGVSTSEPSTKYQAENQQTAWYQATH